MKATLAFVILLFALPVWSGETIRTFSVLKGGYEMSEKIVKSEDEWRAQLGDSAYAVVRNHGTERAFTGKYHDSKEHGVYTCIACGLELFHSDTKYDSGTGWPSFWQPVAPENIGTKVDKSFFMTRTEVHCPRCSGHLGHVFNDGPKPTGLRYCINSVSLGFVPLKKPE